MKKLSFALFILFAFLQSKSQETDSVYERSYNKTAQIDTLDYHQLKLAATKNRTAAITMNVLGAGLIIWGAATIIEHSFDDFIVFGTDTEVQAGRDNRKRYETQGYILMGAGLALELVSIPLYIQTHKYSKMAKLKFKSGNVFIPGKRNIPQLQLRLSIPLGS